MDKQTNQLEKEYRYQYAIHEYSSVQTLDQLGLDNLKEGDRRL